MKKLFVSLFALSVLVAPFSCKESSDISPDEFSISENELIIVPNTAIPFNEKSARIGVSAIDTDAEEFAKLLALSLKDKGVREFLKSEANKQQYGDYDIIVSEALNKIIGQSKFKDKLTNSHSKNSSAGNIVLTNALKNSKLTISIPVSIEKWNAVGQLPLVAVATTLNERTDSQVKAFDSKGNSYLLSSKTEPNVPVIVVRNFEAFADSAPSKDKSARTSGLQEKITYIKCPNLSNIEPWLKGKPELRFEGVVYNDAFSAAFLAFSKDQHPTRSSASGGYSLTQGLFNWNFAGNHGPDYYIQAMELDDTGATYKITITVGKKDSGSASFELSYKDNDEKLAGELINFTTSTPHTVSDSNIEYTINQ
jgi:Protein of unknown function (DUF3103)